MRGVYHPAAIVAAIALFAWGWVWYGLLFAKTWPALAGVTAAQMTPTAAPYIVSAIVCLVIGYGSAIALAQGQKQSASQGIQFGLFFGILFIASFMLQGYMFAQKPLGLWAIDAGYCVSGLALAGLINGAWRPKG